MEYTSVGAVTQSLHSFDRRLRKWVSNGTIKEVMGINKDQELVRIRFLHVFTNRLHKEQRSLLRASKTAKGELKKVFNQPLFLYTFLVRRKELKDGPDLEGKLRSLLSEFDAMCGTPPLSSNTSSDGEVKSIHISCPSPDISPSHRHIVPSGSCSQRSPSVSDDKMDVDRDGKKIDDDINDSENPVVNIRMESYGGPAKEQPQFFHKYGGPSGERDFPIKKFKGKGKGKDSDRLDENSVSTAIREGIDIIMEVVDRLYVKKCEIKRLEERMNIALGNHQEGVNDSFHEFKECWFKMVAEEEQEPEEVEQACWDQKIGRFLEGLKYEKKTHDQWLKLYGFSSDLSGEDRHHRIWLQGVLKEFGTNRDNSAMGMFAPEIQNPGQEYSYLPPFHSVPSSGETSSVPVSHPDMKASAKTTQGACEPISSLIQTLSLGGTVQRGVKTRSMLARATPMAVSLESSISCPPLVRKHSPSPSRNQKKADLIERGTKRKDQFPEGSRKKRRQ